MDKRLARVIALSVIVDAIRTETTWPLTRGYGLDDDERARVRAEIDRIADALSRRCDKLYDRL